MTISKLTAPVGREPVGTQKYRDVVVLFRFLNLKHDLDIRVKCFLSPACVVRQGVKMQLVDSRGEVRTRNHVPHTTIGVSESINKKNKFLDNCSTTILIICYQLI